MGAAFCQLLAQVLAILSAGKHFKHQATQPKNKRRHTMEMIVAAASSSLFLAFLLAALAAIGPFSIDTFLPAMQAIGAALQSSPIAVQQALTLYMFFYGFMMLWHGALSDSFGRRPIILLSLLLFLAASFGCQFANSLEELLFYRSLQGVSGGAGLIIGRAMLRDLFSGVAAQKMMSYVTMMFAFAPAIAPMIGGWLYQAFDWRSIFLFMAWFGVLLFLLCWRFLPESLPKPQRQPFHLRVLAQNYLKIIKNPAFLALALVLAFNFAGSFLYIAASPVFLLDHLNLTETDFIWLFAPLISGVLIGSWLSGKLAGRRGLKFLLGAGYAAMLLASASNVLLAAFCPPDVPQSVLPIGLYTLGMSLISPSLSLLILEMTPDLRGTASSLQGFIQTTFSSFVAGFMAPIFWVSPLGLALGNAIFLLLSLFMLLLYWRRHRQNADF